MLLRTIILGVCIVAVTPLRAQDQSFIGVPKHEVRQQMKKEFRQFSQDQTITRQEFNYLKYVNMSQTITWIIYFSENDICSSTKKVCDYIEYDQITDALNARHKSTGEKEWEYTSAGKTYRLTLEEKDWYFTVRERLKD